MAGQSNEMGMVERMCRIACDATITGTKYNDPAAREAKIDECWQSWIVPMTAILDVMHRPLGEIHVPSDVEQYGINHKLPTFAAATYRSGYIDGHRAALSHDEVKG
ncbi:hypothetical protein [Kaistia terrae]|uniref:Uncharacterized protein n=1 Tax=Kaistia terrae TaxID=537017 RepID=A0ABW0Q2A5_9HYPH|nr:hypothetical protein [Kaistia terrae]MCX5581473.1 hypothetical protein [Kaistia terrae]